MTAFSVSTVQLIQQNQSILRDKGANELQDVVDIPFVMFCIIRIRNFLPVKPFAQYYK